MLRSMFTAIGALNLHQSYLDVIANNLANANTTAYKASRVLFQDQFSQMMSVGSAPTTTRSGTNPIQIGLGVQAGSISPLFTQGTLQSTGRNLDLAIQGDGFFIYSSLGNRTFSREGAMAISSDGYLVNSSTGMRTQGWTTMDALGNVNANSPVGDIQIPFNRTMASATTNASFTGNLNADLTAMPIPVAAIPADPAATPPVVGVPAVAAGTTTITMAAYDALGEVVPIDFTFTRVDNLNWTWSGGGSTGNLAFDSTTGHLAPNTTSQITVTPPGGAADIVATVDFSNVTMLSAPNSVAVATQNGLPAGSVTDVNIASPDGSIVLVYSNGMIEKIGQVGLARFTNPEGLMATGHTMFKLGVNSGAAQIGTATSGGRSGIASSYLEGSNVDMAQEFTNMILAQRGFQASSRVITTSDEIIQELVNLKR